MKTLEFPSREEAEARSRAEWEAVLGREKREDDVTAYLWSIEDNDDGTAALAVPSSDEARLSSAERRRLAVIDQTAKLENYPSKTSQKEP